MLGRLLDQLPRDPNRDVVLLGGGMVALLTGARLPALGMVCTGLAGLERSWRQGHPEFRGGFRERLSLATEHYEATHQDPVNRALHVVGIPLIAGGAAGLLATRPLNPVWWGAAGSFAAGWALNFTGHALFEKKKPAFADDPLSFLAGPLWDARQVAGAAAGLVRRVRGRA